MFNEKDSVKSEIKNDWKKKGRILQFSAAISASITMIGLGSADLWTSPAIPYLQGDQSELKLQPNEGSWLASLFHIGAIIGYFIYPHLIDSIGRKSTLLLLFIPQIASWIITIFAKNIYTLYIARTLTGFGYCTGFAILSIYICEISEKSIRGICLFCSKISYEIGCLFVVTIGAFVSYNQMNLIMLSTPLLFFATFIFMPETPYYFLKKSKNEKALSSLSRLRGTETSEILESEVSIMRKAIIEEQSDKHALMDLFGDRRYRKALLIVFVANLTKGLSGSYAIGNYTQQIFSYSGFSLRPEYSTIVVVGLKIVASISGSQFIEKIGRRKMYLFSGILGSFSLGIVGLFFFLKFYLKMDNLSAISWLPLFGLTTFQIVSAASLNPIPIILAVELFPTKVRSFASAVAFVTFDTSVFLTTLVFETVNRTFGIYSTFWIYAVFCILGTFTIFRITPETKGKSLEEIQDLLD